MAPRDGLPRFMALRHTRRMDPDYVDPAVLKARALAECNKPEDVTVGARPRLRSTSVVAAGLGIRMKDADAPRFSGVSFAPIGVRLVGTTTEIRENELR